MSQIVATTPAIDYPPARIATARRGGLRALQSNRWTAWHLAFAALMAAAGVAVTWPAWAHIALHANKQEYSHIWLVPIVAFCMVWVRRLRIRHCRPVGQSVGVAIVAIGWVISLYGFYNGHQALWHGGAVMVVLGCVLSVLGKQALVRFFPAVAVLVFLVPVPGFLRQQIAIPLQNWTARTAEVVFQTFGVAVERSGNALWVNGQEVGIAEACNGMRMVWPLFLMSFAFSFGLPLRNWVRVLILLASPLSAIFCNVLRIVPNVWLYGFQSDTLAKAFHDYSGWPMLPISFLLLMGIVKLLRWASVPVMRYTLAS